MINISDTKIKKSLATAEDMQLINTYARRTLSPDEVYTFSVILCDNDVDRDGERFTEKALSALATLFVGRTGIFDHNPTAKNQAARIFSTEVVTDASRKNALGRDYCYLEAKAYMLKTEKTANLINEIDGGIKKEVSIGCSMKTKTCSICGTQKGLCSHRAGVEYDGKLCYFELDDPTDAYEWSFVAVPAQKNAGVIKAYGENPQEIIKSLSRDGETVVSPSQTAALGEYVSRLEKMAELGNQYRSELEKKLLKEMTLLFPDMPTKLIASVAKRMTPDELSEMKAYFDNRSPSSQLKNTDTNVDVGKFKI